MLTNFLTGFIESSLAALLTSLLVAYLITPLFIRISHHHNFTAKPNHRSSHSAQIANSGGIALFIALAVSVLLYSNLFKASNANFITVAALVLLLTGIVDDFSPVPVVLKFVGQFLPAILILLSMNKEVFIIPYFEQSASWPLWIGYVFWSVSIVAIINAYNFIDGIDTLLFQLAIFANIIFAFFFYFAGELNLVIMSVALAGGLLGIYRYNVRRQKKVFLGDSGSLVIGGLIGLFAMKFLDISPLSDFNVNSSILLGILFVPVADFFRVIIERVLQGRSPFSADRRHIHHILIDRFGHSHQTTAFMILGGQAFITLVFYLFNTYTAFSEIFSLLLIVVYIGGVKMLERMWRLSSISK